MEITQKFEADFAHILGVRQAFAFWKGRVAMHAILNTLKIGEGDEVVLPGYTCVMNVNPVKYLGAEPVYVDIEPNTFNMNPALLEAKITPKTKVIVAQHTYGYPCDMDAIMNIAEKRGITVIEDCCLALGSKYRGRTVGTFGAASYFSFQWNKPFTTGLGGMVITNDKQLADKLFQLQQQAVKPGIKEVFMLSAQLAVYRVFIYPRTTAFAQQVFRTLTKKGAVVGSSSSDEFNPVMANDFFKKMSHVQARTGVKQLKKLEKNIAHRKQMALLYDNLLSAKGWLVRAYDKKSMDPVMVRYPVRIKEKDKALDEAVFNGIELGSWFECPLHPIETPLQAYDYRIGMCPEAEKAGRQVVNLPLHPRVNEKTVQKTVEFITRFRMAT